MRLQKWFGFGVAVAICAVVSQLAQAEDGRPSRATLEQLGLGGMAVLSDDEALSVRGQGWGNSSAMAFGLSFATYSGPSPGISHSEDAYNASGHYFAKGGSHSVAGGIHFGGPPFMFHATILFAGGSSHAYAF